MKFPEFLTYCELKDLFSVKIHGSTGWTLSINTPDDDIAMYLKYKVINDIPVIDRGQFYRYSDHGIEFDKSYKISMDEIEKVFFPNEIS